MAESRKVQVSLRLLMATMTVVAVAFAVGRASVASGVAVGCAWVAAVLVWKCTRHRRDLVLFATFFLGLFCLTFAFHDQLGLLRGVIVSHRAPLLRGIPIPWLAIVSAQGAKTYDLRVEALVLAVSTTALVAAVVFAVWQLAHVGRPFAWANTRRMGLLIVWSIAYLATEWPLAVQWALVASIVIGVRLMVARVDYALLATSTAVVTLAACLGIDLTKDPGLLLIKWLGLFGICFFPSLLAIDAIKLRKSDHWKQDVTS